MVPKHVQYVQQLSIYWKSWIAKILTHSEVFIQTFLTELGEWMHDNIKQSAVKGRSKFEFSAHDRCIDQEHNRPIIKGAMKDVTRDEWAASAFIEYPGHHEGPNDFNKEKEG